MRSEGRLAVLRFTAAIAAVGMLWVSAVAQESKSPTSAPDAPSTSAKDANPVKRKSLLFPDLATTSGKLGPEQKFKLFVTNSISAGTIVSSAAEAGIGQAQNYPAGYGQGGEGYGKRFGALMASSASDQFFGTFVIASAFREDPRFYVKKDLSFGQAVKYSLVRTFVTKSDSGKQTVNLAGLVGPLGAEFLANTYYPKGDRSSGDALVRYGYAELGKMAGYLARQYWPTLNKKLMKPKSKT